MNCQYHTFVNSQGFSVNPCYIKPHPNQPYCKLHSFVKNYENSTPTLCKAYISKAYISKAYSKTKSYISKICPELSEIEQYNKGYTQSAQCQVFVENGKKLCVFCRTCNGCVMNGCRKIHVPKADFCDKHLPIVKCDNIKCDNTFKANSNCLCEECSFRGFVCNLCKYLYKKDSKYNKIQNRFVSSKILYCLYCKAFSSYHFQTNTIKGAILEILYLQKNTYLQYFNRMEQMYPNINDITTMILRIYDNIKIDNNTNGTKILHSTLKLLNTHDQNLSNEWIGGFDDGIIELCIRVSFLPKDMFYLIVSYLH